MHIQKIAARSSHDPDQTGCDYYAHNKAYNFTVILVALYLLRVHHMIPIKLGVITMLTNNSIKFYGGSTLNFTAYIIDAR